jgi:hypothetical protein
VATDDSAQREVQPTIFGFIGSIKMMTQRFLPVNSKRVPPVVKGRVNG